MAKDNMAKGDFVKAEQLWEKLCSKTENENTIFNNERCAVTKVKYHLHKER